MNIRIVEVGPRDGLQNESRGIDTAGKLAFIYSLLDAGLREVEATSFVSPKWVPQLADADELWPLLPLGGLYSALVPNQRGLDRALAVGVERVALFTAASEAFTQKNINMSIAESLRVFGEVAANFRQAKEAGFIRGYVSTAFECPYSGKVEPEAVLDVCRQLFQIGVDEVSIGDTIGVATPIEVRTLLRLLLQEFSAERIAMHFHDTFGTAISNVAASLELGIHAFDSSAAGLGGCPYAPGAAGNLATDDLVYFLERQGISTAVDRAKLAQASLPILEALGRPPQAKSQQAFLASAE